MPIYRIVQKNIWKLIKQNKLTVKLFDKKQSENKLTDQKDSAKVAKTKVANCKNNII